MSVISTKRFGTAPGRGGIPLNPEDEEEEEGDYVFFPGLGIPIRVLRVEQENARFSNTRNRYISS